MAGSGGALMLALPRRAHAFFTQSSSIPKFTQPLRGVGPGGIPVAVADPWPAPTTHVTHYTIDMAQFTDTLHPALGPTTLWGYNPTRALGVQGPPTQRHLGGILVARTGYPIQITFRNGLPAAHILPVDTTLLGADGAQNRASIHLHGGHVPWISDGGPFAWFTPTGQHGVSFLNNQVLNPGAAPGEAEYYYPMDQSARMLWYHDHALGITRLNAYAGLASVLLIRDDFEEHLFSAGLPRFVENGGREIPVVIQDKIFVDAGTIGADPTWVPLGLPSTTGSLWYPHTYETDRFERGPSALELPDPSVIPEAFGDTMLANGTVYPVATVEARRYRLRVLNACNARFLNLQLYQDDRSPDGITLGLDGNPTNPAGPASFLQLGTEGGFLPTPAEVPAQRPFQVVDSVPVGSLLLGPAERADVLVDFSGFAGQRVILYNDAPAPFPSGDPLNDYFPGNPLNPTQPAPGFGPNTRQIMRFDVVPAQGQDPRLKLAPGVDLTAGNAPLLARVGRTKPPGGAKTRDLTLNETFDEFGRLIQLLGTNVMQPSGTFGLTLIDPPTETPKAGAVEVWRIANLTGDTHPMHFHLVNVQILSRQPFDVDLYDGTPTFTGPARPPDPNEAGWKDTVRMNPGEVTTVIMKFDLPPVPFHVPPSPRTGGNEYFWHCHILEHEEHDMMRPLVVSGPRHDDDDDDDEGHGHGHGGGSRG